ncbi:MAG: coenzyme synthetase [Methylocystaceae bacterium]|nr:MAG: coenzyme synthetase [Methylocystaceae bacterium]
MSQDLLPALPGVPASPRQKKTARLQRERLAEIVAHARARSPYYRDLYRGLPERVEDPTLLALTRKKELMVHFDEWVADRDVTLDKVRDFIGKPELIGEKFLGKYVVATTAGTTGIFVLDDCHVGARMKGLRRASRQWLSAWDWVRLLARGMRTASLHA